MHSGHGVGHFVVEVLIRETEGVSSIMSEIVLVHVVIVQEHASIKILREEVEADIIDVCWHEFIYRELFVAPVGGQGQREMSGLKDGHFSLKILIITGVVVLVSVADSNS